MENNLTVEDIFNNVKEMISLYGETVDELIDELEKSTAECDELKSRKQMISEENSRLSTENKILREQNSNLIRENAYLKQSGTNGKPDIIDKFDEILSKFQSLLDKSTEAGLKPEEDESEIMKYSAADASDDNDCFDLRDEKTQDSFDR